jgi:hypothetical protein
VPPSPPPSPVVEVVVLWVGVVDNELVVVVVAL